MLSNHENEKKSTIFFLVSIYTKNLKPLAYLLYFMSDFFSKQVGLDKRTEENLRVLFALMSLGGKSDRAIAKILGISNTTLSRKRRKLEQEGYVKEYTIIPDLHKIGFEVIVFSFASTTDVVAPIQSKEAQELAYKHPEILCLIEDQGLEGTNWLAISVHKNYDGYLELCKTIQQELLFLHPRPHIELRTSVFHTGKQFLKPFSLRNLESLFQPTKSRNSKNGKYSSPLIQLTPS